MCVCSTGQLFKGTIDRFPWLMFKASPFPSPLSVDACSTRALVASEREREEGVQGVGLRRREAFLALSIRKS